MEKETKKKRVVGDGTPGPGRKKGIPNKNTTLLKEMILAALDKVGGIDYLARQAVLNPAPFLSLVGKVLPLTVKGDAESGAITVVIQKMGDAEDTPTE